MLEVLDEAEHRITVVPRRSQWLRDTFMKWAMGRLGWREHLSWPGIEVGEVAADIHELMYCRGAAELRLAASCITLLLFAHRREDIDS